MLPLKQLDYFLFSPGVFAVVVAALLGRLRNVVGYIFTNGTWVNRLLLSVIAFLGGVIYTPEAADR